MKRAIRGLALLATLAVWAGCSPTEAGTDALVATVNGPTLRLTNSSNRTAYYFVVERETAALILWAACGDPVACTGVAPGATIAVPYSSIAGYEAGAAEAIVYWWHIVPRAEGGFTTDSIRSVVVRL